MPAYEAHEGTRTIIYPIDAPTIRPDIQERMEGDGFLPKAEHHITVVSGRYAGRLTDDQFGQVADFFEGREAVEYGFDPMLYHIARPKLKEGTWHPREALVAPVVSRSMLFDLLVASIITGKLLSKKSFLHVTLATRPDTEIASRGIGIESADEWMNTERHIYALGWQA